DRLGRHLADHRMKLPSLRRALSAGAPMTAEILDRFVKALNPGVQCFTPYGATESLPVSSIGSDEILGETRAGTAAGKGVCVGRPVEGVKVAIVAIRDEPIADMDSASRPDAAAVGEIVVSSRAVTREY